MTSKCISSPNEEETINKELNDFLVIPTTQNNITHRVYCQRAAVMAFKYYINERNWTEKRAVAEAYKQFHWDLSYKHDSLEPTAGCFWEVHKPHVETQSELYLYLKEHSPFYVMPRFSFN
jgi:hypothetical protein